MVKEVGKGRMVLPGERDTVRLWARENRLFTPRFTLKELEDTLDECERENKWADVESRTAEKAFPRGHQDAEVVVGAWPKMQVAKIDQELLSTPVVNLINSRSCELVLKNLFDKFKTNDAFHTPLYATREGEIRLFPGLSCVSLMECLRFVEISLKPSTIALIFRRSSTAVRVDISTRVLALCFPEFVEAFCRCAYEEQRLKNSNSKTPIQQAIDSIGSALRFAQQRMHGLSLDMELVETCITTQSVKPRNTRPLTPRRKSSLDLGRWPHVIDDGLESFARALDDVSKREFDGLDRETFQQLVQFGYDCLDEFSTQDMFVHQRAIPGLRNLLHKLMKNRDTERAKMILPLVVRVFDASRTCCEDLINGMDPSEARWVAENVLQIAASQTNEECPISYGDASAFVVRMIHRSSPDLISVLVDGVINSVVFCCRVLVPLLIELLDTDHHSIRDWVGSAGKTSLFELRTKWVLCVGALLGNAVQEMENMNDECVHGFLENLLHECISSLLRCFRFGSVDPRVCAWAIRNCGVAGQRVLCQALSVDDLQFSARARELACTAIAIELRQVTVRTSVRRRNVSLVFELVEVYLQSPNDIAEFSPFNFVENFEFLFDPTCEVNLFVAIDQAQLLERMEMVAQEFAVEEKLISSEKRRSRCFLDGDEEESIFPKIVSSLLESIKHDPEQTVVSSAARSLGKVAARTVSHEFFFGSGCLEALHELCSSTNSEVRKCGVEALGNIAVRFFDVVYDSQSKKKSEAFHLLNQILRCVCNLLTGDPVWKVRQHAVICLGKFGVLAEKTAKSISAAMRKGRLKTLEGGLALAQMGQTGHMELVKLVSSRSTACSQVKLAAIEGMGRLDPTTCPRTIKAITFTLYNCTKSSIVPIRMAALQALSNMSELVRRKGAWSQVPSLSFRTLHPIFFLALTDSSDLCASLAAQLLAKSKPEGELLLLKAVHEETFSNHAKIAAIKGLALIGPQALKALISVVAKSPALRNHVHRAVSDHWNESSIVGFLSSEPETLQEWLRSQLLNLGVTLPVQKLPSSPRMKEKLFDRTRVGLNCFASS